MTVSEVTISSWPEICGYNRPGWLYRGQQEATWALKTSLERCFDRSCVKSEDRPSIEKLLIREFERTYHHYGRYVPSAASKIEWLSLMQHHGAPTRLLDFTYSIYVAAYFALESAEKPCAVWAINSKWLVSRAITSLKKAGKQDADVFDEDTETSKELRYYSLLFEGIPVRCLVPVSAYRLNERIRMQKGLFLAPGDIRTCCQENLLALPGSQDKRNVVKLVLPPAVRLRALNDLYYMNISRTNLFPGLDGFSSSLAVFHHSFMSASDTSHMPPVSNSGKRK